MRFMWKDVGLSLSIAKGTWGITSTKVILVNKDIIMLTSDQIVSVVLDPIDASFEVCLLTLLRSKNCNGAAKKEAADHFLIITMILRGIGSFIELMLLQG